LPPSPPPPPPPSPPQYLPPSKFSKPIVVADIEETESSTPLPQFLPTIPSIASQSSNSNNNNPKRENQNFIVDLLKYENNVNTSYIPSELHAIRAAMESNLIDDVTEVPELEENDLASSKEEEDVSIILPEKLNKLPLNSNSSFNEGKEKKNLPSSGINDGKIIGKNAPTMSNDDDNNGNVYQASNDLHAFPPNTNSIYLPPDMQSQLFRYTSYIPPPSGSRKNPPARDLLSNNPPLPRQQLKTNLNGRTIVRMPDDESSYQPPGDLHAFPPNVNSIYSPPTQNQNPQLSLFNSYVPPPSGDQKEIDLSSNYLNPSRPITIDLLNDAQLQSDLSGASGKFIRMPDGSSYLPPSDLHSFPPNVNSVYLPPEMNTETSLINSYIPPASGELSSQYLPPPSLEPPPPSQIGQQNEAQLNNEPAGPMMMMNSPDSMMMNPPTATGMGGDMMAMPPTSPDDHDHDHDHHHHHHHDHPWDSYPDYVFDDHHHHHHHVEEITTTTEAPAPEEPRVKKYSYYYLGRKLWYIPLYFTLW
jgi:hypothetical protein